MPRTASLTIAGVVAAVAITAGAAPAAANGSFIGGFTTADTVGSTVPANGDINPYGVVVVPRSTGALVAGDILVSNFNASSNLQGTGTTLVELSPGGAPTLFSQVDANSLPGPCPGGVGLTTALSILPDGYVVVGSLPTTDGTPATIGAGCLLVLDPNGAVVQTIAGGRINGPWDMTSTAVPGGAELFVSNVLSGTVAANGNTVNKGTVVRIDVSFGRSGAPHFGRQTVVGAGFAERTDPQALVIGPTGLAVAADGTLYVADPADNRIAAIPHAVNRGSRGTTTGVDVTANGSLNDPLGLTLAPNGDIITANGDDGLLVETTPDGNQVATFDTGFGGGSLFGLAVAPGGAGLYIVDDGNNTLALAH